MAGLTQECRIEFGNYTHWMMFHVGHVCVSDQSIKQNIKTVPCTITCMHYYIGERKDVGSIPPKTIIAPVRQDTVHIPMMHSVTFDELLTISSRVLVESLSSPSVNTTRKRSTVLPASSLLPDER